MALSTKSIPSVLIVGGANQVARVGDALTIEASGLASGCDGRSKAQRAVDYAWYLYRLDGVDDPEEDWTQLAEGAEFVTVGNCECTGTQGFDPWDTSGAECAAAGCVSYPPLNSFALEALEGLTPGTLGPNSSAPRRLEGSSAYPYCQCCETACASVGGHWECGEAGPEFKLDPFSLDSGTTYVARVEATDTKYDLSNTADVYLAVGVGSVVAAIEGGDRVVSVQDELQLDASSSFDEDVRTAATARATGGRTLAGAAFITISTGRAPRATAGHGRRRGPVVLLDLRGTRGTRRRVNK